MRQLSLIVISLALLCYSCAWLQSPQVAEVFADLLADGKITQLQYDAILESIKQGGGNQDWWKRLMDIGLAIAGSLLGVKAAPGVLGLAKKSEVTKTAKTA